MSDGAQTILAQLGGNRFLAMTGARNLVVGSHSLRFWLPRGLAKSQITSVQITLSDRDLYDLDFLRWVKRDLEYVAVSRREGVYAEDLRRIFTDATGLDCTL